MLTAASEATSLLEQDGPSVATAELELGGMHCSACATRIQRALGRLPAVASASVNLATTRAYVAYDPARLDPEALCHAVSDTGYTATPVVHGHSVESNRDPDHWDLRVLISWPLSVLALLVALAGPESATAGWTVLVLAIVVEIVGGWPFLRDSARLLRHGATSMDTLIALGTLAALGVSAVEAIALGGRHVHLGGGGAFAARLHGVMAPLIVSVLATGRAIEMRARARAAEAMHSLLSLRPPTARVVVSVEDEEGVLVPPESLPVGALIRVRPGEAIPLDGTVLSGWSPGRRVDAHRRAAAGRSGARELRDRGDSERERHIGRHRRVRGRRIGLGPPADASWRMRRGTRHRCSGSPTGSAACSFPQCSSVPS